MLGEIPSWLTYDLHSPPSMLTSKVIGRLPCDCMLRVYLQSSQAVDERMKTAEMATMVSKEYNGKGGKGKGMSRHVAELDKFMGSVTDTGLLQEARRFMGGRQSDFAPHTWSLFSPCILERRWCSGSVEEHSGA
jgi:hypothetical protein